MAKVLTPEDVIRDITHDLPSLQYNVHLTDLELALIPLRKRNHELLLHACSQAAFLVSVAAIAVANWSSFCLRIVFFDFFANSRGFILAKLAVSCRSRQFHWRCRLRNRECGP